MLLAVLSLMRGFLHLPLLFAITKNMMMILLNVACMPFSMTSDVRNLNCELNKKRLLGTCICGKPKVNFSTQKFMFEKSGVEKSRVEKSGVEQSISSLKVSDPVL